MKKRIISLVLLLSMLLTLFPVTAFAAPTGSEQTEQTQTEEVQTEEEQTDETQTTETVSPFTDVKWGNWFYDSVMYVYQNGIFTGTSESTFTPNGTMTRGMFVTVLGRMAGVDTEDYSGDSKFLDVPSGRYYAPYVQWAEENGIAKGISDTTFAPNEPVNRQQMAVFFVRVLDYCSISFRTEARSDVPGDLSAVAPWATSAVLTLWQCNLLVGDGINFNPTDSATRAQVATLATRVSKSTGLGTQKKDITTYYEVTFALGSGQDIEGVSLPDPATYQEGTLLNALPSPGKAGAIFLGWYYDPAMENAVESGDTLEKNLTLYAKMADGEDVTPVESPNYVALTDVAATFTFQVRSESKPTTDMLTLTNTTTNNTALDYTVTGGNGLWTISAEYEPGQTYQAALKDDNAVFVLDGTDQGSSVTYLNLLISKDDVASYNLSDEIKYIAKSEISQMDDGAYGGLFSLEVGSSETESNSTTGTFRYSGSESIQVGDTLAIYDGIRPDQRDLLQENQDDGDVAYVNITAVSGTTYTYEMAEVEDVLFLPDLFPLPTNTSAYAQSEQTISIPMSTMIEIMASMSAKSLDAGDFLGFYEDDGEEGYTGENMTEYGKITSVKTQGDNYYITYTTTTAAAVEQAQNDAMDVYYSQDEEIEMTEEEIAQVEADMKEQVADSGYAEAAAQYLAALAIETDGFQEIPEDLDVTAAAAALEGIDPASGALTLADGKKVVVEFDWKEIYVRLSANKTLDHLQGKGLNVQVKIPFKVTIGDKVEIEVTAAFAEEVILRQRISTSKINTGLLSRDYVISATIDVGNYTGIEFIANIHAAGDDNEAEALGKKIEDVMTIMETQSQDGVLSSMDGTVDSLAEMYSEMMENANDTWFDIVEKEICNVTGSALLHILVYQVKLSFVVSANVNVTIGMKFEYTTQKEYSFSLQIKARKTTTSDPIDVIESQFSFDFYVMGTIGLRAGLRLEIYAGLFSLKLDKVGIKAEAGLYSQLWGYFYYHLEWSKSEGTSSNYGGAMLIEIGAYVDVNFVAQVLSSEKLTWSPTIFSKQWPFWSAGEMKNVYGFTNEDDTDYEMFAVKTLSLPSTTFDMKSMNLKDGTLETASWDDETESRFTITFTDSRFTYDPATNTVTVDPGSEVAVSTEMTIVWKKAALALTSEPIRKVISIQWSDPENARYIAFDSQGGSAVKSVTTTAGEAITQPEDPTRQGYTFEGWFTDTDFTQAYTFPDTMPQFDPNNGIKGVTLYAKWSPAPVKYLVEHYQQEINGTYSLFTTESKTALTGSTTEAAAQDYTGFTAKAFSQDTVRADGTTVIEIYYQRNSYTITFDANDGSELITQTYLYGQEIQPPSVARESYLFGRWDPEVPEIAAADGNYVAQWTEYGDTPYRVEHYQQNLNDNSYSIVATDTQEKTGAGGGYITPAVNQYPGFTSPRAQTAVIAEDGSTVVRYYYTRNSYTITWSTDGDPLTGEYTEGTFKYGTALVQPETPTKTDYTFDGWYSGEEAVTLGQTVTEDLTLTAHFTPLPEISSDVFVFPEDQSLDYVKDTVQYPQYTFTPETNATYTKADFTLTYYQSGDTYTPVEPKDAGTYDVVVSRPGDKGTGYATFEVRYENVLTIQKGIWDNSAITFYTSYTYFQPQLNWDAISDQATVTISVDDSDEMELTEGMAIGGFDPGTTHRVTISVTGDPNYDDREYNQRVTTQNNPSVKWTSYAASELSTTISTPEQLAALANAVNSGNSCAGQTFTLTADLDLTEYAWEPIGCSSSTFFCGTFDGGGHTISGMFVDSTEYAGLFGCVGSGAVIENLWVENSYVRSSDDAAGIVAYARASGTKISIKNCLNGATVVQNGTSKQSIGGIVGYGDNIDVDSCTNYGSITGYCNVGGIMGKMYTGTIENCINYGDVAGSTSYSDDDQGIGGIVGWVQENSTTCNSVNFGSVSGRRAVGGVMGKQYRKTCYLYNVYNAGEVTGYSKKYIGAVIGRNDNNDPWVEQCYYLSGTATASDGNERYASGSKSGSDADGTSKSHYKTAYFMNYSSALSHVCEEGTSGYNLIDTLNAWATRCNASAWVATSGTTMEPVPVTAPRRNTDG